MKGRNIIDDVLFALEMASSLNKKVRGSMIIKLDMQKAFDRVLWNFLFQVLQKFSCIGYFCLLVKHSLQNIFFSILINGAPVEFFKAS